LIDIPKVELSTAFWICLFNLPELDGSVPHGAACAMLIMHTRMERTDFIFDFERVTECKTTIVMIESALQVDYTMNI